MGQVPSIQFLLNKSTLWSVFTELNKSHICQRGLMVLWSTKRRRDMLRFWWLQGSEIQVNTTLGRGRCKLYVWGHLRDVWANKLHVPPEEKWYCGSKYVSLLIKGMEKGCRGLGRVPQAVLLHQCFTLTEVLVFRGSFCALSWIGHEWPMRRLFPLPSALPWLITDFSRSNNTRIGSAEVLESPGLKKRNIRCLPERVGGQERWRETNLQDHIMTGQGGMTSHW